MSNTSKIETAGLTAAGALVGAGSAHYLNKGIKSNTNYKAFCDTISRKNAFHQKIEDAFIRIGASKNSPKWFTKLMDKTNNLVGKVLKPTLQEQLKTLESASGAFQKASVGKTAAAGAAIALAGSLVLNKIFGHNKNS